MEQGVATVADAWKPASELERRLEEAVLGGDQEAYFRLLAESELVIPVPPDLIDDVLANEAQPAWPTQDEDGRTHVLAYTSAAAMRACLGPAYLHFLKLKFTDLAQTWPDPAWWLAVDALAHNVDAVSLPIEGRLPAWFIRQLTEGEVMLPQAGRHASPPPLAEPPARASAPPPPVPSQFEAQPPSSPQVDAQPPIAPPPPAPAQPPAPSQAPLDTPIPPAPQPLAQPLASPTEPPLTKPSDGVPLTKFPGTEDAGTRAAPFGQPATDTGRPFGDADRPATEADRPAPAADRPAADLGHPAANTSDPPADADRSATDAGRPITEAGLPATDAGRPATDAGGPVADAGRPPADVSSPATDAGRPAADAGRPITDAGRPPADVGHPVADAERPVADADRSGAEAEAGEAAQASSHGAHSADRAGTGAHAAPQAAAEVAEPQPPIADQPGAHRGSRRAPGAHEAAEPETDQPQPQPLVPEAEADHTAEPSNEPAPEPAPAPLADAPRQPSPDDTLVDTPALTDDSNWEELQQQHRKLPREERRPEFQPANDVERGLLRAAAANDHDLFLQTLADAEVLLPVPEDMDYTLRPGRPGFPWQTAQGDGGTVVPMFTSPERLAEAAAASGAGTDAIKVPFTSALRYWPDLNWSLAVNSGSPAGGTIQAGQLPGLAKWADERTARRMAERFEPQNDVEQRLFDAARRRDTDAFFKVLLGAQVLVPAEAETPWGIAPEDDDFPWRPVPVQGRISVQVFTSLKWMNEAIGSSRFVMPSLLEMVTAWPDVEWTLVLNPGTPIDATMPGEQVRALSGPPRTEEPPEQPAAESQPEPEPIFEPGNRIDQELYEAALSGDSDAFLRVLLAANVLVPIPVDAPLEVTPIQREFRWEAALRGDTAVQVFTSLVRLREVLPESRFVYADFRELIGSWPRDDWAMLLNPGTRIGASLRGDQVRALSEWAIRVGLLQPRESDDMPAGLPTPQAGAPDTQEGAPSLRGMQTGAEAQSGIPGASDDVPTPQAGAPADTTASQGGAPTSQGAGGPGAQDGVPSPQRGFFGADDDVPSVPGPQSDAPAAREGLPTSQGGFPGAQTSGPAQQNGIPGPQGRTPDPQGPVPGVPGTQGVGPGAQDGPPSAHRGFPGTEDDVPSVPGSQSDASDVPLAQGGGFPGGQNDIPGAQASGPAQQNGMPSPQGGTPDPQGLVPGMPGDLPSPQDAGPSPQRGFPGTDDDVPSVPGPQGGTPDAGTSQGGFPGVQNGIPGTRDDAPSGGMPGVREELPGVEDAGAGTRDGLLGPPGVPGALDDVHGAATQGGFPGVQDVHDDVPDAQADVQERVGEAAAQPYRTRPPMPTPEAELSAQPTVMQKVVPHGHVTWYLEQGYDRVGGFVYPTSDVADLQTPVQLYEALGLLYEESPFSPADDGVYVIRWPAYCSELYRIPFGGQNEEDLEAWGESGWVIERPPFHGGGFAPGSAGSIREYKVDSVRLPYGAEMYYLGMDRSERFVAMYDPDRLAWLRPEAEAAAGGSGERSEAGQ